LSLSSATRSHTATALSALPSAVTVSERKSHWDSGWHKWARPAPAASEGAGACGFRLLPAFGRLRYVSRQPPRRGHSTQCECCKKKHNVAKQSMRFSLPPVCLRSLCMRSFGVRALVTVTMAGMTSGTTRRIPFPRLRCIRCRNSHLLAQVPC
jgi:hypothetical protein